jgi:putative thiamine transport system permease protein
MTLGALAQVAAPQRLATARSLGYGPTTAWLKAVLPAVYPLIRLPLFAVLAYSLSVVDMALILGPATPPSLAVLVFRWFNDPDLSLRFMAAAGASLQLVIVVVAIALWELASRLVGICGRRWAIAGGRGGTGRGPRLAGQGLVLAAVGLGLSSILVMALWSLAQRWRYPDALPSAWTLQTWTRHLDGIAWTGTTTLVAGLAAAGLALALVVACLENERRRGITLAARTFWLLYLPLLVPQVGFLFGTQVMAVRAGLDGGWLALVWSHLLFVLPYVYLALAQPYRALDERYERSALCLGASRGRVFRRVTLPMLLRPIAFAFAVGFAVSVAQYLPTLFAGAGRFATLTTEAVALAGGSDRRILGVYAFLQAALPLAAFALAVLVPAWVYRNRQAMGGWR